MANSINGRKTSDGIRIGKLVKALNDFFEISIVEGSRHALKAIHEGIEPCVIAQSTNARHYVVPWVKKITNGNYDTNQIYTALKKGKW